jgi:predicted TIM-barrel fold metal-dependent hydrolase
LVEPVQLAWLLAGKPAWRLGISHAAPFPGNSQALIDAHAHLPADHPDAYRLLDELGVQVLNISLGLDVGGQWREQPMSGEQPYQQLAVSGPARFAWCTAFNPPTPTDLEQPSAYTERVLAELARDFKSGAVACKVWKNIGLEVRDRAGEFVMVDSPLLTPIFELIAREDRVLILHTGEPRACWLPLDPASPHFEYYSQHPEWYMHGRRGFPAHAQLIAARDRVLQQHPKLRVVGAHLGSLEYDVGELVPRFERFANFSVDTAERLLDLSLQPPARVRALFEAHPERLLYGSDLLFQTAFSAMSEAERQAALAQVRRVLEEEQAYFRQAGPQLVRGKNVQGLGLSSHAQRCLFDANARRCYALG